MAFAGSAAFLASATGPWATCGAAGAPALPCACFCMSASCWFLTSANFCRSLTFFSSSASRDLASLSARSFATLSSSTAFGLPLAPSFAAAGSALESFNWSLASPFCDLSSTLAVIRPCAACFGASALAAGAACTPAASLDWYERQSDAWAATMRRASGCATVAASSLPGRFKITPLLRRLMLPPTNASGLLRWIAINICSRLIPSGLTWRAILPRESPRLTS